MPVVLINQLVTVSLSPPIIVKTVLYLFTNHQQDCSVPTRKVLIYQASWPPRLCLFTNHQQDRSVTTRKVLIYQTSSTSVVLIPQSPARLFCAHTQGAYLPVIVATSVVLTHQSPIMFITFSLLAPTVLIFQAMIINYNYL